MRECTNPAAQVYQKSIDFIPNTSCLALPLQKKSGALVTALLDQNPFLVRCAVTSASYSCVCDLISLRECTWVSKEGIVRVCFQTSGRPLVVTILVIPTDSMRTESLVRHPHRFHTCPYSSHKSVAIWCSNLYLEPSFH